MAMQTVILHNVKLSFFCVAPLIKMGSHKKKKKKKGHKLCLSVVKAPSPLIPTWKEKADRGELLSPEE